jgi:predicted membrane channel-forming protein YqfA (hemolysin III family)
MSGNPAAAVSGQDYKARLLVITSLLAVAALCFVGPIPQDQAYHQFADTRRICGVPNFWNVVSNLPFLIAGLYGLWRYPHLAAPESRAGYLVLCLGTILVGFGSAYYHLAPSNASLLWDRLPMTVAFMALLSLLLGERITGAHRHLTLLVLVTIGVGAALYWSWTEAQGRGDLRPYVLVQFLPMVLIPLILFMYPQRYIRTSWLLWGCVLYVLAKACEYFDRGIYAATGFMSGHALKHLVAALAVLCIIVAVSVREPANRRRGQP